MSLKGRTTESADLNNTKWILIGSKKAGKKIIALNSCIRHARFWRC